MDQSFKYKVACFGAGFVGIPTSSVLALHNPEIEFIVYDINKERIKICSDGKMPIFEPKLEETVAKVIGKNLRFTYHFHQAVDNASVIFLALPTPTKTFGQNAQMAYDLSYTEIAIDSIINYFNENPKKMADNVIIVQKSTVPIGTARMITKKIGFMSIQENKKKYIIASNPQFLAQGTAIADLMNPCRIVIGVPDNAEARQLFDLYTAWKDRIIRTNQYSSELAKLAANCFLAQRVSSINSIAMICEHYQADITDITKCLASDLRIGSLFLNSSVGFGGSCFKKDILALVYLAQAKGLNEVADYWKAVININTQRKKSFFRKIYNELNQTLKKKKITIFGTAFKKETSDTRDSPAIDVCYYMLKQQAILMVYDPKATLQMVIYQMKVSGRWEEKFRQQMIQCKNVNQACLGSSAIVVLTEWDEFKTLDYKGLAQTMNNPPFVFDGRNILDEKTINQAGLLYCKIGKTFHINSINF